MEGQFKPAGRTRAAAYRSLWLAANALQKGANGCLWIAAGLLQRADLQAASQARWHRFGTSIDEIDSGLDVAERRVYAQLLDASDRVLLVGCGTGRDVLALHQLGYNVTGLEQVPQLVTVARSHMTRRSIAATIQVGSIESTSLMGPFDIVLFSLGVYSCLPRSQSRISTLERMKGMLSDRGRVVISYYEQARPPRWGLRLARLGGRLARTDWRPEEGDVFSRDYLTAHVLRYEHVFRPEDVARECDAAGLRVTEEGPMNPGLRYALAIPVTQAASALT